MTQSVAPGIVFNGPNQNTRFSSVEQNLARGGASPLAPPPAAAASLPGMTPDGGIDFAAVQEREAARNAEQDTERAVAAKEQAALEAEHGQGETFATQAARGALSALLSPGALVGAAAETLGALASSKTLEDFGRDFGKASTGRSAIEAIGAGFGAAFDGDEGATDAADRARVAVDAQERAWPLLSAGAQIGGGLAFAVATGGLASGSVGAGGLATAGAIEGAGAGAQAAYDVDAPLTEVWTNALLGGTLGAALGAAPAAAGKLVEKAKRADLAKVFGGEGSMLGEFAETRAFKAVGGRGPEARRLGGEPGVKKFGGQILDAHLDDGTPIIPRNPIEAARIDQGELTERLAQGMHETGEKLGALRQNASKFIDESAPELRPSMARLSERLEAEVMPAFDRAAPGAQRQAREVRKFVSNLEQKYGDEVSLEDFFQERLAIDRETNFNAKAPDVMKEVRRVMEDEIEQRLAIASDRAGLANDYKALKQKFGALKQGTEMSAKASGTDIGNRWLSLSDNMVGMATVAGDLATGGGLSLLKGAAVGLGHKILREQGSIMQASLFSRFRKTAAAVDVATAGGREAQDAVTEIIRAKNFIKETAEAAGPNANVRAVAENTAQEAATQALIRTAGEFDPAKWAQATRAPSPLARVLYRPQILDTVSQELAPTIERSVAMRPGLDFDLDPTRLARFSKDAEGTDAIAAVQAKVREIADMQDPASVAPFESMLERLNTASPAEAMVEGHNLARSLAAQGNITDARALQLTLGDDLFGTAGKAYRQMTAPPSDVLREMSDPAKLREALKTLELRGQLTQQIADEHRATLSAFDALKKLTGEPAPAGIQKQMRAVEELWSRAEESVTLDGTRLGRIVDVLDNMTENRVASKVPRVSEEQQVQATVQQALKPIEQTIKRSTGKAIVSAALRGVARPLTQTERITQYEQRLDQLAQATVNPDTEQRTAAINEAPAPVREALVTASNQKVANLMRDMPKPRSTIQGTAYDSLSSEEMRKGNAMWEATMNPMSVFEDFAGGQLDPDKVAYAWKQYPGLQRMAQLGVLDVLQSQLTADERSAIPGNVLTQLDFMLGFKGGLQSTVSFEFSQRISGIHEQLQQENATQAPPNRSLQLPAAKPTMTQRIAGAQ